MTAFFSFFREVEKSGSWRLIFEVIHFNFSQVFQSSPSLSVRSNFAGKKIISNDSSSLMVFAQRMPDFTFTIVLVSVRFSLLSKRTSFENFGANFGTVSSIVSSNSHIIQLRRVQSEKGAYYLV